MQKLWRLRYSAELISTVFQKVALGRPGRLLQLGILLIRLLRSANKWVLFSLVLFHRPPLLWSLKNIFFFAKLKPCSDQGKIFHNLILLCFDGPKIYRLNYMTKLNNVPVPGSAASSGDVNHTRVFKLQRP